MCAEACACDRMPHMPKPDFVDFNAGKTQHTFLDLFMWKRMGLFPGKSHFLRYWGCLSLLN